MKSLMLVLLGVGLCCLQVFASKSYRDTSGRKCFQFNSQKGLAEGQRRGLSTMNMCKQQSYQLGHEIQTYEAQCNVEPKNDSLNIVDSMWTYYLCMAQKSMGDKEVNLTNYAEMMAKNLAPETKSEVLSNLKEIQTRTETKGSPNSSSNGPKPTKLQKIQKYWDRYFAAEFSVCTVFANDTTCNRNNFMSESLYVSPSNATWDPVQMCGDRKYPDYRIRDTEDPFDLGQKFADCLKHTNASHPIPSNGKAEETMAIYAWCWSVFAGINNLEDMDKPINFERIYDVYLAPRYFSKSVKDDIFKAIQSDFSTKYVKQSDSIMKATTFKDVSALAVKHLEVKLKEEGHNAGNVTFLTNGNMLYTLSSGHYTALVKQCSLIKDRKSQ